MFRCTCSSRVRSLPPRFIASSGRAVLRMLHDSSHTSPLQDSLRKTILLKYAPSELLICVWCGSHGPFQEWACPDCKLLIQTFLHDKEVKIVSLSGGVIFQDCESLPGSLPYRDALSALCPGFLTERLDLIRITPCSSAHPPVPSPIPDDYPIGLVGDVLHGLFQGSKRQQIFHSISPERANATHEEQRIALVSYREYHLYAAGFLFPVT